MADVDDDITALDGTITALIEAVAAASSALSSSGVVAEDMGLVSDQAKRAHETVAALKHVITAGDERFVLLHRLNNQLTGILSLALLQRDDCGPSHPATPSLDRIDVVARDAAARVKRISTAIKAK